MPRSTNAVHILDQLLRLRALNALPLVESAPGRGVWRYGFRCAGQPVTIDLDTTVLCIRVYHDRDEVAMSAVTPEMMDTLMGRRPVPAETGKSTEAECLAALRQIVAQWRDGNARIYMRPPAQVGHPDNWNRA
jgi:hypothetical protein